MPHHPTDLLEAYALHLLSPDATQEVADHLATCAECRAEVAAQTDALSLLAYAAPPHLPPPDLEDRLMARIGQIRRDERVATPPAVATAPTATAAPIPLRPRTATQPPAPPLRRAPVWVGAVGALAAVIVLALVGVRFFAGGTTAISYRDRLIKQARAALHVPNAPVAFLTATSNGPAGAVAVLATDPATDRAVVVVGHMPSPGNGHIYEFWLVHGTNDPSHSSPQGTIPLGADGAGELDLTAAGVTQIQNAGISVEPAGQPITTPDSPMVMLLHG